MIEEKMRTLISISIISFIFIILNFFNVLYETIEPRFGLGYWPNPTLFFHLYLIFWNMTCFYGFTWLLIKLKKTNGLKKQQIKYVTIACAIGYIGGATNWPVWYNINIPPYPNIGISLYVAIIAYSVVRYRLMDLNLILRWGMAYGTAFLFLASILLFGIFVLENFATSTLNIGAGISTIVSASIVVLLFEPTTKFITRVVDKFIFKSPDFQSILVGIEINLNESKSIHDIGDGLVSQLKKIWNIDHAGVAIWNSSQAKFQLFPESNFKGLIIDNLNESILPTDFLVRTLETERRLFKYGIILDDELKALSQRALPGEKTTFSKIRRTMRWLGAEACVPLMVNENLVGFIILGPKKNSVIFNEEDKKFLSHVSEIVSKAIHEIFTENHTLQTSRT